MSNDTLDKIDEAIKRIQDENYNRVEIEEVQVREDTDTKIFNSEVESDSNEEIVEDIVVKKSNIGIYISYFIFLLIIVCLVIFFIMFLYK